MKEKIKCAFTGLFYVVITAGFIALSIYNLVLTPDMKGYMAVLTFVVAVISMAIGVALSSSMGRAWIAAAPLKKYTECLEEDADDGEEQ